MTAAISMTEVVTLEELYGELAGMDMTAGWLPRESPILRAEPTTAFKPTHWRYAECKAALDAAGRLINTELAERRNLIMRNAVEGNDIATARTLVSAYQMILPGEKPSSQHNCVVVEIHWSYTKAWQNAPNVPRRGPKIDVRRDR